MITFTIGFLAGGIFGVVVGATVASGRIADLIKENARLRRLLKRG